MERLFNDGWEFTKQGLGCNITEVMGDSNAWRKVDIPHDWMIYDTAFFQESCEGWYRKYFTLTRQGNGQASNSRALNSQSSNSRALNSQASAGYSPQRYLLQFDGVYMDSTVYVNDIKMGEWKYGYSAFEFDITDALTEGTNEILVRVILQVPNSRWYTGGGIYRNVRLRIVPSAYLASDGIYITCHKTDTARNVRVECEVIDIDDQPSVDIDHPPIASEHLSGAKKVFLYQNDNPDSLECSDIPECKLKIRHIILDHNGTLITLSESSNLIQELSVAEPQLWDITDPYLYTLRTELLINGEVIDERCSRFGFRTIRFDPDNGFYLNERQVKLHGVCQHHDLGALGAAVNRAAVRRQLLLLKAMGVNAVRTAHNMCATELLELADELGILVASEAFDVWERPKNTYDYARFFPEWAERDVTSWVRRERNHPCVILWSIGNEIYDTHADERGQELTRFLMELVNRQDPYHNAYVTIGSNYMPWENAQKCADLVKLAGYNYGEKYYDSHHEQHKDWIIYGSETGSVVQSRGIYHFPLHTQILSDDDEQCSSLGNSITSWGARSIEACILKDRDADFSAGMFVWSGFDYIGEPTPYHTKNSYFGQLDTAGFPKDSYYIYQAAWTDYRTSPMVHLFPYWDFNEGQRIDVRICSNAPRVELFFNGSSQGSFDFDPENGHKLIADWQLPYRKGELRTIAYDKEGNIIAEDLQRSFSDSHRIILRPDKVTMEADGRDLIFVEISMEDVCGNPVRNAVNRVNIKVTGAGRLIGLDNGDSTDYESYKGTSRRLFGGKLLAIIAAKTMPGVIYVQVSSEGLPSAQITFAATEVTVPEGITALEENIEDKRISGNTEIPVRKLELISPLGTNLNEALREVTVEARIYPENATYKDISWRAADASGVNSNIVKITPDGSRVLVRAAGDGSFYLRAAINNGGMKPRLISMLDFRITGLGTAYLDPYGFIFGCLYSRSSGEITSGNERGIATARDGESIVLYENLDFGMSGSDEITIPIFELAGSPAKLEIWEGFPHTEGSVLLADVIYHKKSIWNTYQEETYRLKKRLTGTTSVAFLLRSKVHIKGFSFKASEKAYEQLSVLSCSSIYGDSYTLGKDSIDNIGNNVTITFEGLDFGQKGIRRLVLCGRTLMDKNTIIVCFKSEGSEVRQLAEFSYSPEFTEREFVMDNVTGIQTVSFLFLPGCDFDFNWFRFYS